MKPVKEKQTIQVLKEVMDSDIELLRKTKAQVQEDTFDLAVNTICRGRHVYILGVRSSAPLAQFLSFYLNPVLSCVRLVQTNSASEIYEQMLHVGPNDVVIGISFPRYSMRVLKALEFANSRNAKVIAITDEEHSPITLYSSCNLYAESKLCSVMDSLTSALSLINALVTAIYGKKKKKVMNVLRELERVWDDYPVNNHDEMNPIAEELKLNGESL